VRVAIALAVLVQATHAFAQPDAFVAPSARAAQLFNEGRELKAAGNIDEACKRFEVSWKTERATGTELNLADCRERQGKLLEAFDLFDEAARTSEREGNATRATFARQRRAAIDARLMTLEVRLGSPIAKQTLVTIDGQPAAALTRIEPKAVSIRASAPGGKSFMLQVQARAGKVVVDVPSLVRTTTARRSSRLWIAGGLVVLGAVGAVTSQRFAMMADDQRERIEGCTFDTMGHYSCENDAAYNLAHLQLLVADQNQLASRLFLGGSALAIVGAAVVWYTAPKERVLITPTATTSSVGVSLAGRF
jgi:hypothetical protein